MPKSKDSIVPIGQENFYTITVGEVCFGCVHFIAQDCPYGNHLKQSSLEFGGDRRGKCNYYYPAGEMEEEADESMEEAAMGSNAMIKESQLDYILYKKFARLNDKQKNKFEKYWEHLFPKNYVRQMDDDVNTSYQKFLKKRKQKRRDEHHGR